jgi:hypothetical protein
VTATWDLSIGSSGDIVPIARTPVIQVQNPVMTPFQCHVSFLFFHFQEDVTQQVNTAISQAIQSQATAASLQANFQAQNYSIGPLVYINQGSSTADVVRFRFCEF